MKRERGIALLMMLIMISSLAIVVMICAFVLSHEVNKDERYDITRQRMLKVKRALIGRLADVSDGEDITSCGGFISDYGEPDSTDPFGTGNFLKVLLDRNSVTWLGLPYDYVNEFWAGYRGERYLNPPSGETDFKDGWGYSLKVSFLPDDQIEIKSLGSDGVDNGSSQFSDYRRDIPERFYWRRDMEVKITNTSGNNIKVRLVYPDKGVVKATPDVSVNVGDTIPVTFSGIPVGLRKIEIEDGGMIKRTKMLCLPPGSGPYTMEPIDYSG